MQSGARRLRGHPGCGGTRNERYWSVGGGPTGRRFVISMTHRATAQREPFGLPARVTGRDRSRAKRVQGKTLGVPLLLSGVLLLHSPAVPAPSAPNEGPDHGECVVLLHGLARSRQSMEKMAAALADTGFLVANVGYPSRSREIEELAPDAVRRGLERCAGQGAETVHFVTHSMGGILVRYYLGQRRPANLGRVVMLSPPNQGSEAADHLKDSRWYQWYNGPAGQQLVTGPDGLPAVLGPVDYPLGVITGDRHSFFDAWLAETIPGPDDGKVAVERAKVAGMSDFLVLPYSHPFIMNAPRVIDQTIHFLREGRFREQAAPGQEPKAQNASGDGH